MTNLELEVSSDSYKAAKKRESLPLPLWLWPNVLSLDAVFIAVLWHVFLAHLAGLYVGVAEPSLLALSVWVIYVLDHVFDSWQSIPPYSEPVRKLFYRRHGTQMLTLAGTALAVASVLAVRVLSSEVFRVGAAIAFSVVLYFGVVHLLAIHQRSRWPREILVGLIFSIGTVVPLTLHTAVGKTLFIASGSLFFLVVWINCCTVETSDWHRAGQNTLAAPHASAIWVSSHLPQLAIIVVVLAASLATAGRVPGAFAAAVALSSVAMAFAGSERTHLDPDLRTLLVDAALCSPILISAALWNRV